LKPSASRALLLTILAFVGALSLGVREVNHLRRPGANGEWFSADPDSMYHMRRVDRALSEGLPVAQHDRLLDFPARGELGAPIPWPPYYTYVGYAFARPGAPVEAQARRVHVEQVMARLPSLFAALASVLAALAAYRLFGASGALVAGVYHAFLFASLKYSYVGNADHHAFVSCLHAALLFVASRAFEPEGLRSPKSGVRYGIAAGVLCGVMLGAWVAALIHLVLFELALFWMGRVNARTERAGFGPFALSFHLAAAIALVPAAISSPWSGMGAEAVLNLSWLHVLGLLCGALAYAPPLFTQGLWKWHASLLPWVAITALLLLSLTPFYDGIEESGEWATGADRFMANINESQPLFALKPLVSYLGYGVFVLPIAWAFCLRSALRGRHALFPWVVAVPALFLLALLQRRFAELLGVPLAVTLGGLVGQLELRFERARVFKFAFLLALFANAGVARTTWKRLRAGSGSIPTQAEGRDRAYRAMYAWLGENTPAPDSPGLPEYSVLAQWDHGHGIEWVGERATIATNFGSYLGEDSYLDPWRFFLETNQADAEKLLERRRVRYILMASDWQRNQQTMQAALPDHRADFGMVPYLSRTSQDRLGFLRAVYVSRLDDDQHLGVSGTIYEYVPGAWLEVHGSPGATLVASLRITYAGDTSIIWSGRMRANAEGGARMRVPYCTDGANGDGRADGLISWSFDGRRGEQAVPEDAVYSGLSIELR